MTKIHRQKFKRPVIDFAHNINNYSGDKPRPVVLRVYYDRVRRYINTGVMVRKREWKKGQVVGRLDLTELNEILSGFMLHAKNILAEMTKEGDFDFEEYIHRIKQRINNTDDNSSDFFRYIRMRSAARSNALSDDSKERYNRFIRWFDEWGGMKYFSDITPENILLMDEALKEKGMCPYSAWNNYHRFLNSFILDAIEDGKLKRNPYKRVNIDKSKTSRGLEKYLTEKELQKIIKVKLPHPYLVRTRDLFIFQTYTCMAYTDLMNFNADKLVKKGGRLVYRGYREKTKSEFLFIILRPAMEILKKYDNKLPHLSNVKYNEFLKEVARYAGINKKVSSHWARHTGATLLLNKGLDMETVAKVLGHTSTRITREVYAKLLDETVIKRLSAFDELL